MAQSAAAEQVLFSEGMSGADKAAMLAASQESLQVQRELVRTIIFCMYSHCEVKA
jgi:hypothetical protein